MTEAVRESAGPRAALSRALDAALTSVLRIVCSVGLANAILLVVITVAGRPTAFAITAAIAWAGIWWLMIDRADGLRRVLRRRPALLVGPAILGMVPFALDGGLQGTLGTQVLWLTWVAAVTVSAPMTLMTAAAMTAATVAALAALGMTAHDFLAGPDRFQAALLICNPLLAAAVGLALVGVFRGRLAGVADELAGLRAGAPASTPALTALLGRAPEPLLLTARADAARARPWGLTQAEQEIVALLRSGLTVKQIALERNGSVLTVRTHVKHAKSKVGARTISELITRTWPTG